MSFSGSPQLPDHTCFSRYEKAFGWKSTGSCTLALDSILNVKIGLKKVKMFNFNFGLNKKKLYIYLMTVLKLRLPGASGTMVS